MKPYHSFPSNRRTLTASAMAILLGAATAVAQSSSTSATGSTGSDTSRRNQSGTSTTPGTYSTGSTSSTTAGAMTGRETTSSGRLSWGDRRFVQKAADGGHDELNLAQLAAQRATSSEVKSFAQKLVDDHTKVNSELMSLASQKNVKVDTDNDKDRTYKRLNKKSGSEFDQEFVEHMIDDHEKDIKMFEKAASDAKDPEVRAFASKHVSDLRAHLQQAEGLRQSLMPTGRMDDRSGRSTPGGTTSSGLSTSSTDSTSTSSGTTTTPDSASSSSDTSTTGSGTSTRKP
jgi:putative membrane protein